MSLFTKARTEAKKLRECEDSEVESIVQLIMQLLGTGCAEEGCGEDEVVTVVADMQPDTCDQGAKYVSNAVDALLGI
jgi:hypothetical protein